MVTHGVGILHLRERTVARTHAASIDLRFFSEITVGVRHAMMLENSNDVCSFFLNKQTLLEAMATLHWQ